MKKWFKDKAEVAEDYVQSTGGKSYVAGWERVFGKLDPEALRKLESAACARRGV